MAFGQTTRHTSELLTSQGQIVSPAGIASTEAFGTLRTSGNIKPSGIAPAEAFGTLTIRGNIKPSGIASTEAFGVTVVVRYILPAAISSSEAFGSATVNRSHLISPVGIASAEAFGATTLPGGAGRPRTIRLQNKGIASALAFGLPNVVKAGVRPSGIASTEAFGTASVRIPPAIVPSGIASREVFGFAVMSLGKITPPGIASAEAFGRPTLLGPGIVSPQGIPSREAFGIPRLTLLGLLTVQPQGIASAEAFGPNDVVTTPSVLLPTGIASALAFGRALVLPARDPAVTTPRDVLTNLTTGFAYAFPINHETEEATEVSRGEQHGAPNGEAVLVRQQNARGGLVLHLQGAILDPAQQSALDGFFDACDSTTLLFHHANGDEYEVVISRYDAPRQRGLVRGGRLVYWRYTLELDVVRVRAGAFAELV